MTAERPESAEERLVAEALQRAFGGPVPRAALLDGRAAVQAAAALAAEQTAEDAELVTAALTGAFAVGVDAETRADQIAAIAAAARPDNVVALRRFGAHVGRHAAAAMVAVSTLAGGSGVAAASTGALPGEALYPVKRVVEQVMLTAAFTPGFEARVQTTLAARRLNEAEKLLAGGAAPDVVAPLLSEYERHVAVVAGIDGSSAAVEVAALELKADALREQTTTSTALADPQGDDAPVTTTTPTEATPAPTPTETTTSAPESTTTTSPPESGSSTGTTTTSEPTSAPSGSDTGSTSTQPAPTTQPSPKPTPSPTPTPTPTPEPTSEADADVEDGKKKPPGQAKRKPNVPSPSPTANPDREPLPDGEETSEIGPLADWEERATYTEAD